MAAADKSLIEEMLKASPDALVVIDEGGIIETATEAVARLFGYPPDDLIGLPIETLLPARLRDGHVGRRDAYLRSPEVRPMGISLELWAIRRDGTEFPVDVSLVPTSAGGRLRVGAFVRDASAHRRSENLQRFVNEISQGALSGTHTPQLLDLAARRARTLVGAELSWVAVRSGGDDRMVVAAADGPSATTLVGATVPFHSSLAARAMVSGTTVTVEDMAAEPAVLPEARNAGLGPGLYLPMLAEDGPVGALVLARHSGAAPFAPDEVTTAEVFAAAAAVVLALGRARQHLEASRATAEHERIARDLHDTVIQRLFALGMRLQATQRLAEGPVAERIRTTVDSIDEVIREIRETIFDLNRPDSDQPHLRAQVKAVASEAAEHLGFSPRLAFRGPVEVAVSDELSVHLLSVLREALTNVARHAHASTVDVVIIAADGNVTLNVADDGIGISDSPTAGDGTANMASRARQLGGQLTFTRRSPSGTLLQWRVPRNR